MNKEKSEHAKKKEVVKDPQCPTCGSRWRERDEKTDAYYCKSCGRYLEEVCGDKNCEFCKNRGVSHTPAKEKNE